LFPADELAAAVDVRRHARGWHSLPAAMYGGTFVIPLDRSGRRC
jgi:hypothetical protein